MIAGVGCSETMTAALFALPPAIYERVEAALRQAFAAPGEVQQYESHALAPLNIHLILSNDVQFILGDTGRKIQLLHVTLFQPEGPLTLH